MLKIQRHRLIQRDLENLGNSELSQLAKGWTLEIAESPKILGKPLGRVKGIGDLTGFWAVKFDLPGFQNRYRIVFQYRPDSIGPVEVYFISIGPRFGYQVYRNASQRLWQM